MQAQELLGVRAAPAAERDVVAYLPRAGGAGVGAFNGGRRVANEADVLAGLADALEGRRERLEVPYNSVVGLQITIRVDSML